MDSIAVIADKNTKTPQGQVRSQHRPNGIRPLFSSDRGAVKGKLVQLDERKSMVPTTTAQLINFASQRCPKSPSDGAPRNRRSEFGSLSAATPTAAADGNNSSNDPQTAIVSNVGNDDPRMLDDEDEKGQGPRLPARTSCSAVKAQSAHLNPDAKPWFRNEAEQAEDISSVMVEGREGDKVAAAAAEQKPKGPKNILLRKKKRC